MNEVELAARLRAALEGSGRTAWELSHRANVKLALVEDLVKGSGMVPICAVVRVAEALELELHLEAIRTVRRAVGPVSTVVDDALKRLSDE